MFPRLRRLEKQSGRIKVAVVGSGFVARGLVHQLMLTPGITCSILLARNPDKALAAFADAGHDVSRAVVSDDPETVTSAIEAGLPTVATIPDILGPVGNIDVVVEATGDVGHGAHVGILAINSGKHFVSLNYETDATVGPILRHLADRKGVVYTGSDGDQPAVMMRLYEYVDGIGLDVVAAVNCKGFLDVHATPETIRPWAKKQRTSLTMTTAFTDGTKMNVENACLANATGLVPTTRGMFGIRTTLKDALTDFQSALDKEGVVEYTLGGDFGSGVFVIGSGAHPDLAAPYLEYLKMGPGPWYLFYRPWHLVQMETPLSIAEAVLDGQPTIAPKGAAIAQVVTIAKRDLPEGRQLDGIGGYDCYGEIDLIERSKDLLPIGLAEYCHTKEAVSADQPIALSQVDLNYHSPLVGLWRIQQEFFDSPKGGSIDQDRLTDLWGTHNG